MLLPLSPKQEQIFRTVSSFITEKNYPPTIPEVQRLLDIENPGAIHKCFTALERKGYIVRKKGMHRGLDLTQEAKEMLQ